MFSLALHSINHLRIVDCRMVTKKATDIVKEDSSAESSESYKENTVDSNGEAK